jgi:hypothetical protein
MPSIQVLFKKEITGASTIGSLVNPVVFPIIVLPVDRDVKINRISVNVFASGNLFDNITGRVMVVNYTQRIGFRTFAQQKKTPVAGITNGDVYYVSEKRDITDVFLTEQKPTLDFNCLDVMARALELKEFWFRVGTSGQTLNLEIYLTCYYE